MNKLFIICIIVSKFIGLQAQDIRIVEGVTAGKLFETSNFTYEEMQKITELTIVGIIDARDFAFLRSGFPKLSKIDLSKVKISAYKGFGGTVESYGYSPDYEYLENEIPISAFFYGAASSSYGMQSLISIVLPQSIEKIGNSAFRMCYNLQSINLPDSLKEIGDYAFYKAIGIESIEIPAKIRSMGALTFCDCIKLSSIVIKTQHPEDIYLGGRNFENVNKSTCNLIVPAGSENNYKNADQWKEFINILEIPTAVYNINKSQIQIYTDHKRLKISNLKFGDRIKVYTISGELIIDSSTDRSQMDFFLNPGIYVLKINERNTKIIIK